MSLGVVVMGGIWFITKEVVVCELDTVAHW